MTIVPALDLVFRHPRELLGPRARLVGQALEIRRLMSIPVDLPGSGARNADDGGKVIGHARAVVLDKITNQEKDFLSRHVWVFEIGGVLNFRVRRFVAALHGGARPAVAGQAAEPGHPVHAPWTRPGGGTYMLARTGWCRGGVTRRRAGALKAVTGHRTP